MWHIQKVELSPSVSIIIAGAIIALAIVFSNQHRGEGLTFGQNAPTQSPTQSPITSTSIRPPSGNDHIVGSPSAPIVLVEYSDFQCPYCSLIYPTLKRIVGESNGSIAWVYREFPLTSIHPQALPAANAAECIAEQLGNAGFWKYADAIFADQTKLSPAYSAQLAASFGVDPTKYATCIAGNKYGSVIGADTAEVQRLGSNGTPFVVVLNTKTNKAAPVSGALPYEAIMQVIQSVR